MISNEYATLASPLKCHNIGKYDLHFDDVRGDGGHATAATWHNTSCKFFEVIKSIHNLTLFYAEAV